MHDGKHIDDMSISELRKALREVKTKIEPFAKLGKHVSNLKIYISEEIGSVELDFKGLNNDH